MARQTFTAVIALILCASTALAADPSRELPFTVSKETTAITSPLRPDGTPDYVAALNEMRSIGVTSDNNGFVLYLQAVGTGDAIIHPSIKSELLKKLGTTETPPGQEIWITYPDYLRAEKHLDNTEIRAATREYDSALTPKAGDLPLTEANRPLLADFIKAREKQLSLMIDASNRPNWWVPRIAPDGHLSPSAKIPEWQPQQEVLKALAARATMRATSGDFDRFLEDILAIKRLSRHMGADWPESIATFAVARVAASGTFTAKQCETLRVALRALPPSTSPADPYARWHALEVMQRIAMSDPATLVAPVVRNDTDPEAMRLGRFADIDRASVNWDTALMLVNQRYDQQIAANNKPTIKEKNQALDQLALSMMPAPPPGGRGGGGGIQRAAGETREAYTDRAARWIIGILAPTAQDRDDSWRDAIMREEMLDTLLAAAGFKASQGHWPATLNQLVPAYIDRIPLDIYSPNGMEAVSFARADSAIWIYSPATIIPIGGAGAVIGPRTRIAEQGLGIRLPEQARAEKLEGRP